MNIQKLIQKTEKKAGLPNGAICQRNQRLKKNISGVSVSEIRRALVFVAKQKDHNITYQEIADQIGFKRHSTVIMTYRNAQNFFKQGDDRFYKALNLVVKN
jgi:chromosomal replication initiation ATPase DnaA